MANVTIYEYFVLPDVNGDLPWPADVTTTQASSATLTLNGNTRYVYVCADADCRVGFNGAAVASGMVVLSAIPNRFKLSSGTSRTLQFA